MFEEIKPLVTYQKTLPSSQKVRTSTIRVNGIHFHRMIKIAQPMLPSLHPSHKSYLPSLQEGEFFCQATGEVFGKSLWVNLENYQKIYISGTEHHFEITSEIPIEVKDHDFQKNARAYTPNGYEVYQYCAFNVRIIAPSWMKFKEYSFMIMTKYPLYKKIVDKIGKDVVISNIHRKPKGKPAHYQWYLVDD